MSNYAEEYFEALEALVGRREDSLNRVSGNGDDGLPHVYALFYKDWPHPGVLTAFTLGAGLGRHVRSLDAHVELVVSVKTEDLSWGLAVAFLAEQSRSHLEFDYGTTLNMQEPIAEGSAMTGLFLTPPHHWSQPPRLQVAGRTVVILEARPVYPSELECARAQERQQLLGILEGPTYDGGRPAISLTAQ
ncbi:MAG: hypothetical protein QOI66_4573 [Myxococcales bacterium]|jgi:hypothetical protein|nr:hypothetical protein [Myxococcales bacterium]